MALHDYIHCGNCGVKLLYDGDHHKREILEARWGNPDFNVFTVKLLCPDCIKELQAEVELLRMEAKENSIRTIKNSWGKKC